MDDPKKGYSVGFFRCNGDCSQFSLEKPYSRKIKCTLYKLMDYRNNGKYLFASQEVVTKSNTLTDDEIKVFKAWEKTALREQTQK